MDQVAYQVLGGLGLFIFGMRIMSEGLKMVAGHRLRTVLSAVSSNRIIACATGALVTSIIQSSSTTTVMLVGFVEAGLMSLTQAIGVILGANVGTTVTAQLIAFKLDAYALPAIAAGVLLRFFVSSRKWQHWGEVLLGFGMLFYGLTTMKAGLAPLKSSPEFINFLTEIQAQDLREILLCVLIGTIMTMAVQSSSATVGVTMALASQGLISFEVGVAFILGDNIGTTITAELASIGASLRAHQAARAHTLFNLIGVFLVVSTFPYFIKTVTYFTMNLHGIGFPDLLMGEEKPYISRHLANAHTLFNTLNAILFLSVLPWLVNIAMWLTPRRKNGHADEVYQIKYLDKRYLDSPEVALMQARREIIRMGGVAQLMFDEVIESLTIRDLKRLSMWKERENVLDHFQREITDYLVKIMQENLIIEETQEIASLMRMSNNIERIGDEVEDIAEGIERIIEDRFFFSERAMKDYATISSAVKEFIILTVKAMKEEDKGIFSDSVKSVSDINKMADEMRSRHYDRLVRGTCEIERGMIFVDLLNAFEKINSYSFNVSQAIAGVK
ncbi:MAG: Na/Pi cotransporter family protein [Deltaproteobacteria bacterium]|nr:Na/Pi cotransporter family protein [Deltaproteobacteria bacterium]